MILSHHGVLQLLVTSCALVAVTFSTKPKGLEDEISLQVSKNQSERRDFKNPKSAIELVKSHRREPRFDALPAASSYVKVFNRPPGASNSFYNYETRGNTSAHTSGEVYDFLEDRLDETNEQIERGDLTVKDILRVKPNIREASRINIPKSRTTTATPPIPKLSPITTKIPDQVTTYPPVKADNQKKGFLTWRSSSENSKPGLPSDSSISNDGKNSKPSMEQIIPKDGSHWKVIGDGGEDGWQVVDDKGEVEWKIEYDDGEWRVISTADVPSDAEWIDPDYYWANTEGTLADEPEYNSWADDYRAPPPNWSVPTAFYRATVNRTLSQNDAADQKKDELKQIKPVRADNPVADNKDADNQGADKPEGLSASKADTLPQGQIPNPPLNSQTYQNEKVQYGARRKIPTRIPTSSSVEDRTNADISAEENSSVYSEEKPQNDQLIFKGKSWSPEIPVVQSDKKWIQGYGSKTWEGDSTGLNSGISGETWITTNKNFAPNQWVPKVPSGTASSSQTGSTEENNTNRQDNSVRAWGTGYGSKTWKGNEWNSNVVWKTGFNSGLPWAPENSTWKFPDPNSGKKSESWSQPIPSDVDTNGVKFTPPPSKKQNNIQIKWPTRPTNKGNTIPKYPPSRRQENESWSDDDTTGGVIWKQTDSDDVSSTGSKVAIPNSKKEGWQANGWKISTPNDDSQPTIAPWKNNGPSKTSNLVSVSWKAGGENPVDPPAVAWNQGQWPDAKDASFDPIWIFKGCKMTLKCGSNIDLDNVDDSDQSSFVDTSDEDSIPPTTPPLINFNKGWPPKSYKGKSWKPPKSWRPPKQKQPTTPPPTPETMSPTIVWKPPPPTPKINWKKPTPPPDTWKQPPTVMWTETTPAPQEMTWKPPPPPMKWKKGPRPTKSWRPPPTKSWKPPKFPVKTWQPAIATPQPDMWPTTKPDCKDKGDITQPPPQPTDDDDMEPPQIIIITKLPKGVAPGPKNKKDKDDTRRKPPSGPWTFPPRKYIPKSSKNRKDKITPTGTSKGQPIRPSRKYPKYPNMMKGWPKGMPPPKFAWPNNAMKRWTTTKLPSIAAWKSKYPKSRTWTQMFKKWMSG